MCFLYKCIISNVRNNFFLIFGLFLGVALSSFITELIQSQCVFVSESERVSIKERLNILKNDDYEPVINLAAKPLKAQKTPKDFQRPRYYKTELGIRDKLLVAVLTSPQTVKSFGATFNRTTNHLVDKIVFFMESESKKSRSDVKVNGIVQFPDSRLVLKPFHMLKYIIDNFLDDYDYFLLVRDKTYIRGKELYNVVQRISVSESVHVGSRKPDSLNEFCTLNSGILLSNSLFQKVASKLDWCVKNAFLDLDDDNVGKCIVHTTGVGCTNKVQGLSFSSFYSKESFKNIEVENMSNDIDFNKALTFWPIGTPEILLELHAYFSKLDILQKKNEIAVVRNDMLKQPVILPDNSTMKFSWPIGSPPPLRPANRFDLLRWDYFTDKKIFLKSDFDNMNDLSGADLTDIMYVLNTSVEFVLHKHSHQLHYAGLINGYRRFDPSRGMDYILDLSFKTVRTGKEVHKRIEICKSLGKVELITMPYVTENTRVNMIVIVDENNKKDALKFIENYVGVCMEKKDKTYLMMVLLYPAPYAEKEGKDDLFAEVKRMAAKYSDRFRRDNNKIGWLGVKLPEKNRVNLTLAEKALILNSGLAKITVLDLVVKKFVPDNLLLYCTTNMEIRQDFINRVRMNTIKEHQVFSPIPFSEFDPDIVYNEDLPRPKEMDINRNYGHYDKFNTDHISFYVKDYREARKTVEEFLPIIHSDRDLLYVKEKLDRVLRKEINKSNYRGEEDGQFLQRLKELSINSVYAMFAGYKSVHVLRGIEPGLRLRHVMPDCSKILTRNDVLRSSLYKTCLEKRNFNSGSRSQLGHFILEFMHECITT